IDASSQRLGAGRSQPGFDPLSRTILSPSICSSRCSSNHSADAIELSALTRGEISTWLQPVMYSTRPVTIPENPVILSRAAVPMIGCISRFLLMGDGCGGQIRTGDLRLMRPASYLCSTHAMLVSLSRFEQVEGSRKPDGFHPLADAADKKVFNRDAVMGGDNGQPCADGISKRNDRACSWSGLRGSGHAASMENRVERLCSRPTCLPPSAMILLRCKAEKKESC